MSRSRSLQGLGFEDLGEQIVKNLSRPVRSFALRASSSEPIAFQRVSRAHAREDADHGPHRRVPSIAVLPFSNLTGDPEQEYFADGIAEDIITALSKISNLLVISRNSTFAYKGKAVDVHTVGRELNVRYVLEGSVRKAGGRVRITAQLVEAAGRQQLWAVRFDRELDDIFALQDEITSNVVAALHVRLIEGEQARVWHKGTKNFDAWECLMQGLRCSGTSPRTTTARPGCCSARRSSSTRITPWASCGSPGPIGPTRGSTGPTRPTTRSARRRAGALRRRHRRQLLRMPCAARRHLSDEEVV